MTTKELLHLIVDELSDDQELLALEALEGVRAAASSPSARRTPSSWAVGDSGYTDTSENVDAVLAEGFGRSRTA